MLISRATAASLPLLLIASAASGQFVGITANQFDGGAGLFTINRACNAAHAGSRICTPEEIFKTVNPPVAGSPGEQAWVNIETPAFPLSDQNCYNWTSAVGSGVVVNLDNGSVEPLGCQNAVRVACCIPVPEPSASVTIPSGAAMVFALAKLRPAPPPR